MSDDLGAYEFALPQDFNYPQFKRDVARGENGYWAIAFPEKGITRFKGVLLPSYVRVMVDYPHVVKMLYIVTPQNQEMTPLEVARWFFDKFPGGIMYKDGKQIFPDGDSR